VKCGDYAEVDCAGGRVEESSSAARCTVWFWRTAGANPSLITSGWSDQRAAALFDELVALVTDRERQELGSELRPSLPVSFLYWMSRNGGLAPPGDPVLAGRISRGEPVARGPGGRADTGRARAR